MMAQLFAEIFSTRLILSFSLRQHQNMSLSYANTVSAALANRKGFLDNLGIDYKDLVCAKQVHSSTVTCVSLEQKGSGALIYETALCDTDALITDKRRLPLAIFTADCPAVFLFDPGNNIIGLAHAGWRPTKEKILKKTIKAMTDKFSSKPKDIYAGFGPAIRKCCYQVGKDFKDNFSGYLLEKNNKLYFDLIGINKDQLEETGINPENIFDSGGCTCCNPLEYFSYRREKDSCGRMMSVIMLK